MSLVGLPMDIWRIIAHMIDGKELFKLLMVGNLAFSTKLRAATERFVYRAAYRSVFPFSAYQLPHLKELTIVPRAHVMCEHPFLSQTDIWLPLTPMQNMIKLSLPFSGSLNILMPHGLLAQQLPNLESLVLVGHRLNPFDPTSGLQQLPPRLTQLSIQLKGIKRTFPLSIVSELPRSLCSLDISAQIDGSKASSSPNWPPGLTNLSLVTVNSKAFLSNLPPNLQSFTFAAFQESSERCPISRLPRSLKSLKVYMLSAIANAFEFDAPFPEGLELLSIHPNLEMGSVLPYLPRSLTFSNLRHVGTTPNLANRLPHLKYLKLTGSGDVERENLIHPPPAVSTLVIPALPMNTDFSWTAFPYLTKLTASIIDENHIPTLPSRLQELSLKTPHPVQPFRDDIWRQFPAGSQLRGLHVSGKHFKSISSLSLMRCTRLEALNIIDVPKSHWLDPDFGLSLPATLQSLIISTAVDFVADLSCLRHFSSLLNLRRLDITLLQSLNEEDDDAEDDDDQDAHGFAEIGRHLKWLPRSLHFLSLSKIPYFEPTALSNLPRALESLKIVIRSPEPPPKDCFTDAHFQDLPTTIHRLDIQGVCSALTPSLVPHLPPGLQYAYFYLQSDDFQRALEGRGLY